MTPEDDDPPSVTGWMIQRIARALTPVIHGGIEDSRRMATTEGDIHLIDMIQPVVAKLAEAVAISTAMLGEMVIRAEAAEVEEVRRTGNPEDLMAEVRRLVAIMGATSPPQLTEVSRFDIFLSYSSSNAAEAQEVFRRATKVGLSVF